MIVSSKRKRLCIPIFVAGENSNLDETKIQKQQRKPQDALNEVILLLFTSRCISFNSITQNITSP